MMHAADVDRADRAVCARDEPAHGVDVPDEDNPRALVAPHVAAAPRRLVHAVEIHLISGGTAHAIELLLPVAGRDLVVDEHDEARARAAVPIPRRPGRGSADHLFDTAQCGTRGAPDHDAHAPSAAIAPPPARAASRGRHARSCMAKSSKRERLTPVTSTTPGRSSQQLADRHGAAARRQVGEDHPRAGLVKRVAQRRLDVRRGRARSLETAMKHARRGR